MTAATRTSQDAIGFNWQYNGSARALKGFVSFFVKRLLQNNNVK